MPDFGGYFSRKGKRRRPNYQGSWKTVTDPARTGDAAVQVAFADYVQDRKLVRGRKRRRTLREAWRLLRTTTKSLYLRFQGVNAFNTANCGYFKLINYKRDNNEYWLPCHFYNLSACFNNNNGSLVTSPVGPYQPYFANVGTTNGELTFNRHPNAAVPYSTLWHPGQGPTAGGSGTGFTRVLEDQNYWVIENTASTFTSTDNAVLRNSYHKYVDVRMLLYGATTRATTYIIQLIRFTDENVDPLSVYSGGASTAIPPINSVNEPEENNTYAAYTNMISPFTSNPINVRKSKVRPIYQVLYTKKYEFTATPTVDGSSTIPTMRQVSFKFNLNRIAKYDWADESTVTLGGIGVNNDADYATVDANCLPVPRSTSRIYLLIRARVGYTNGAGSPFPLDTPGTSQWSAATMPSYDMVLRTCHEYNN